VFANEILIDKTKTSSFEPDGQLIPQRSLWSLVMVGTAMAPGIPCYTSTVHNRNRAKTFSSSKFGGRQASNPILSRDYQRRYSNRYG
jgi:hypothetical protein